MRHLYAALHLLSLWGLAEEQLMGCCKEGADGNGEAGGGGVDINDQCESAGRGIEEVLDFDRKVQNCDKRVGNQYGGAGGYFEDGNERGQEVKSCCDAFNLSSFLQMHWTRCI
ncbi:hypothetical protein BU25DRAFT_414417 [Macroventuria anomochaeta]|uniref:Uncharacterized protein n=1 Tax=Macroventuria anomochaeta TaxID=301207 RepID=A0ACB6RNV1_9PLEO|nr:uncharacterized protein BU25DRAFT_414417 [Macroventuria anomochaeta]KAF2623413.1 hypothetical protein BU25DRAFT_414417 [Macroventuria anomochaeta]